MVEAIITDTARSAVIDPQGWRGTIGLINPSLFTSHAEHEFRYLLPEGVGLICQRVLADPKVPFIEALNSMHDGLPSAAYLLSTTGADMVSFNCTSSSFLNGKTFEHHMVEVMEKASSLPCVCAAGAVADSMRFLGVEKVLVISPYPEEVNKQLESYLTKDQGIGVHCFYPVALEDRKLTPWQQFKEVLKACRASPSGADAIFFSCGATRLIEVVPLLEDELGIPVLTTNLCNVWKCLQALGIHKAISGKGKILDMRR
ncbi:MAG: hypothetical protein JXA79_13675 [Deltaproteobacteria bacterium]|nr:hypothetical protein [Deltaproteobacteria bacterium]